MGYISVLLYLLTYLLCHQELVEQMQLFKTFMFHTVVQRGF